MASYRVLHTAGLISVSSGILNQMLSEQKSARSLNIPWDTNVFTLSPSRNGIVHTVRLSGSAMFKVPTIGRLLERYYFYKSYFKWLEIKSSEYDILVIRYLPHSFQLLAFLKQTRKPVFLVHHTLEGPEINAGGTLLSSMRSTADDWIFRKIARLSTGAIGVTGEINEYEKKRGYGQKTPSYVYPNGVDIDESRMTIRHVPNQTVPTLMFTASRFTQRQGLELLLKSCQQSASQFKLNIIGEVTTEQKGLANGDPRIEFHGPLSTEQIEKISEECHLGLGAFSHSLLGMKEACTLKVREYLSLGLPVYAGHSDVIPSSFPFYRKGPCDIDAILKYVSEVKSQPKSTVILESAPFIDKKRLLQGLYSWLCKLITKQST